MMCSLTFHYQVILLFIFFLYAFFQVSCTSPSSFPSSAPNSTVLCQPKQSFALLQFKNSTFVDNSASSPSCNISYPKTDSWKEDRDCCSWNGVTCDKVKGNVIGLDLECTRLRGTIQHNSSLFQLSHLQWLNLAHNDFTGQLPSSLSKLEELIDLDLSGNTLEGQVPDVFGNLTKLTQLDLSDNGFNRQLPPSLFNHTRLTDLSLLSNNFSGSLPYHVSGLSNLISLDLSNNFLNGRLPSWLFTLPSLLSIALENNKLIGPINRFKLPNSLRKVYLGNNMINGSIPGSIFELVNLTHLDLSSNKLSGTVKFDMLPQLKYLKVLDLSYNTLLSFSFTNNINYTLPSLTKLIFSFCNISEFPSSLGNLKNLAWLDLSNNGIHGGISKSDSEGWESLTYLNLSHNFLTYMEQHPWKNILTLDVQNNFIEGSVLVPPPTTRVFFISNNKLSGLIPPSICNLSSLRGLALSNNNLSGKIPHCLGNFSIKLSMLHLGMNNFHGSIPNTFANESWLMSLHLNDNNLEGPLPRSLANCSWLEVVNVGNNKIRDTFPNWLGTLPELKVLILRSNRFYGLICDSKTILLFPDLRIIDLSHNEFKGTLAVHVFENLKAMMNMNEDKFAIKYMGGSYYHDFINVTMKGQEIEMKRISTIFTSIDFSNNQFHGEIPKVIGNFKSLIVLNLSHNSLTGNIPFSLGNSTALESLDLSSNKLNGEIPEQLKSLTFLAVLDLSYNQLRGTIPQGGQFATYESDSFIGNKELCGQPLPKKCSNNGAPQPAPSHSLEKNNAANEFNWKMAMMGYGSGLVIGLSIGYIVFSTGKPLWFVRMVEGERKKKVRRPIQRPRR